MGDSILTRRAREQLRIEREAEKARNTAAARQMEAEHKQTHLDRERAAAYCGLSLSQFKRRAAAGKLPQPIKLGDTPQSRCEWRIDDLAAWKAARSAP